MILKKSKTKWVEVEGFEGVRVKIDYPTIEQTESMRELFFQLIHNNPNHTKEKDALEIELNYEQKARENILLERIAKTIIRFCVKDWEGVTDEDEKIVPCKLVKNEIEKELYNSFISNFDYQKIITLGNTIQKEIEFNEADKKKSFSEESAS